MPALIVFVPALLDVVNVVAVVVPPPEMAWLLLLVKFIFVRLIVPEFVKFR